MKAERVERLLGRLVSLVTCLVLIGCGGKQFPTPDAAPTETALAAQAWATQTALAPTSTPTPEPTSTPTRTPTPTREPTATREPSPTPVEVRPTPTQAPQEPQAYIVTADRVTTYSNPAIDTEHGYVISGKTFVILEQAQEEGRIWLHIQLFRPDGSPGADPWILADEAAYRPYTEPPRPPEGHFLCPQAPPSTPLEPFPAEIHYQPVTKDYAIGDSRLIDGWVDEGGYLWVKFWFRSKTDNQVYTLTMRSANPSGLQVEVYRMGVGGSIQIPLNEVCVGDHSYFYALTADDLDPRSGKQLRIFTEWGIIRRYQ